jgi:hypothetical protein
MKKHIGLLIGVGVIIIGIAIMFKGLDILWDLFRIVIGGIIIFVGVKFLTGGFSDKSGGNKKKNDSTSGFIPVSGNKRPESFKTSFGSNTYDFSGYKSSSGNKKVSVNVSFGKAQLRIKKETAYSITGNITLGHIQMPDGNSTSMGTLVYRSPAFKDDYPHLSITIEAIFASVEIVLLNG